MGWKEDDIFKIPHTHKRYQKEGEQGNLYIIIICYEATQLKITINIDIGNFK